MLVGLKEVAELLLERVNQGVVGAVEEERLHRIWKEMVDRRNRMMIQVVNYWSGWLLGGLFQH